MSIERDNLEKIAKFSSDGNARSSLNQISNDNILATFLYGMMKAEEKHKGGRLNNFYQWIKFYFYSIFQICWPIVSNHYNDGSGILLKMDGNQNLVIMNQLLKLSGDSINEKEQNELRKIFKLVSMDKSIKSKNYIIGNFLEQNFSLEYSTTLVTFDSDSSSLNFSGFGTGVYGTPGEKKDEVMVLS